MIKKVYPILTTLLTPVMAGVSLVKKDLRKGGVKRFVPQEINAKETEMDIQRIWVHAASAGEVQLANLYAKEYLKKQSTDILLTTNTESGIKASLKGPYEEVRYFAFDSYLSLRKIFDSFKPQAIVLVELELWPGLIELAKKKNVPVFVLNARVSQNSVSKLQRLNNLFTGSLSYPHYLCRSDKDMDNLLEIGVALEKIIITGEMKIDLTLNAITEDKSDYNGKIMLAVSTHSGEEKIILEAFEELKKRYPDLKLLLAPRHQRRVGYALKLASKYGFASTCIKGYNINDLGWAEVWIEDRFGRMDSWFKISRVAIVGGSFVDAGCHNVLEPVFYGLPVLVGPFHGHWSDFVNLLDESGVLSSVETSADIARVVSMVIENESELAAPLVTAKARLLQQKGVTKRNVELIHETLKGGNPFGME